MLSAIPTSVNLRSNASNQGVPKTTTCLLKTAIATVSAGGGYTKPNILFDEGAQRSFVSQKLSTLLKLHPHNTENIRISGFGAQSPSDQLLGTVNFYVQSLAGEQMPVSSPELLSGLCQEYSTPARPCIGTSYYKRRKF